MSLPAIRESSVVGRPSMVRSNSCLTAKGTNRGVRGRNNKDWSVAAEDTHNLGLMVFGFIQTWSKMILESWTKSEVQ